MGIFVSQRPGRAAESDPLPANPDEISSANRRRGIRKTLIGGRLVTVRLGPDASGLALDLSESGMGLRAFPNLEIGSTTSLFFELPDLNARVEAVGKVEWVERAGSLWSKGSGGRAGLSFMDLSDTTRSLLNQWLSDDLPRPQPFRQSALAPPPEPGGWFGAPASDSPVAEMRRQLQQERLSGLVALQWIAERVLRHSGADGTAIALDDGQGMVCRASLGNAPDFGVRIHSASGLSGECVRTGQIVRCDDTENDPRVDPVLCRELKLRCALILPLYHGSDLCGVLEVFSARPFAFAAETVSHLQQVSQVVVEVVSGMMSEPGSETGMPGAQADAPAARVAPQLAEESVQAPTSGAASDSAARESRRPVKTAALSDTIPCDVCGYANHRGQRICSKCDVPLSVVENFLSAPTSEQVREVEAAALLARSRYGVGERLSPAPVVSGHGEIKRDLKPLIGMGTLLVLIFLGFGLWRGTHSKVATQQPQAPLAAQSQPAAAQSQPAAASSATPVPSAVPAVAKTKKAAEPAKPKPASAKTTLAVSSSPGQEAASVRWIMGRNAGAKAAAEVEPAPLPVSAGQIPHLPYIVVVPEPPRMEAPASAAHTAEPASGGAITGGNLIRKVAPVYPPIAKSVGKQGSVVLTGTVDRQGMLKNLRAIEGDPMLIAAAIDAAQKWRYEPYRLNGSPIEIETKIVFHFRQ